MGCKRAYSHLFHKSRARQQTTEQQYTTDEKELLSNALYTIKESGQLEWALKEWDKKKMLTRQKEEMPTKTMMSR